MVMGSLLGKFAGKIDLIYIDPPFATGADFSFTSHIGDSRSPIQKDPSVIEEKAFLGRLRGADNPFLVGLGPGQCHHQAVPGELDMTAAVLGAAGCDIQADEFRAAKGTL